MRLRYSVKNFINLPSGKEKQNKESAAFLIKNVQLN